MSQQQPTDKGQRDLFLVLFTTSFALLSAAIIQLWPGGNQTDLPATLLIGGILAFLALVVGLFLKGYPWLKIPCLIVLALEGILAGAFMLGIFSSDQPDSIAYTWTATATVTAAAASTITPDLPMESTATTISERPQTPTTTPTPAETPTATPSPAGITSRDQTSPASTDTPTPRSYPAPRLQFPEEGHAFSSQELPTLKWEAIPNLAPDDRYLLHLEHGSGVHWEVIEASEWRAANFGFRDLQPANGRYLWWVAVCRNGAVGASGVQPCELASAISEPRYFTWPEPADPLPPSPPSVITPDS